MRHAGNNATFFGTPLNILHKNIQVPLTFVPLPLRLLCRRKKVCVDICLFDNICFWLVVVVVVALAHQRTKTTNNAQISKP